jgi:hypothetical protein
VMRILFLSINIASERLAVRLAVLDTDYPLAT